MGRLGILLNRVEIGRLEDFPEGKIHGVDLNDKKLIGVNLNGILHALDGICMHAYAEFHTGFLMANTVWCPLHLSQFDVDIGEALSAPAEESLDKHSVEVEGGKVYVVLE